jgi:hypothetical protein
MTEEQDRVCRRVLAAIIPFVIIAACHGDPDTSLSPTPLRVAVTRPDGSVDIAVQFASADLGGCLGGLASPSCFSLERMQTAGGISAAVSSAPIGLSASVNGNTVTLAWSPPALQDQPVTSYVVEAASMPNFSIPNLASFDTTNPSTGLTAPGVPAGTYYVRVRARNALGLSAPSNEVQVVVGAVQTGCPGSPRSMTASRSAVGIVSLSWLAPLVGSAQSYLIEAGSAPGLANLANMNTGGTRLQFAAGTVPPGSYYVRARAQAAGCPSSAPSNEALLVVPGGPGGTGPGGSATVTLTLSYTCRPCVADPDNYALNVACVQGRCRSFRASNPLRSPNTIRATVSLAPGTHEMEVVVRNPAGPWNLSFTSAAGGGVVPASFVRLFPFLGSSLTFGQCTASGQTPEAAFTFRVMTGTPNTVC